MTIKEWQKEVHDLARAKGWYRAGEERNMGEVMMNIASEVSEAWEAWRDGKEATYFVSTKTGEKPEGVQIELADVVIRIMDTCEANGWDLEECIRLKHEYNQTRPYRHGGKRA